VLFSLILPRFLKLARPAEAVTVLLRSDAAKMAFLFPPLVNVMTVNYGRLGKDLAYRFETLKGLRAAGYRLVVSTDYLRHPYLDEALAAACGAEETYAMEPRPWAKYAGALRANLSFYTKLYDSGAQVRDKIVRWSDFANWLTGRSDPPPRVRLAAETLPRPVSVTPQRVLIQPFSAVKSKQLPPAVYADLMEAMPGYRFSVLGAPSDLERNPEFKVLLDKGADFDASGFKDLVPLLRAVDLVISVDTALMHLAVAVGAKTLCLASAAYVGEIVPYAPAVTPDNVTFLYHDMPCQGCLGSCIHPLERGMYPCVACLTASRLTTTVKNLLKVKG